jgi:7-cyano-7-deazaguanine synthase
VLLSGGLDSTVALALAGEAGLSAVAALFFDYGQHAARREERAARAVAERFSLGFERIELPWLARISSSALVGGGAAPPWRADRLDDASPRAVWVENRNGILVNIAAFFAAETGCDAVIAGFNREEAEAFPDNSEAFVERINAALELGCARPVRLVCPTIRMTKRRIVERALALDIPWELLWSCYGGGDRPCGSCESCLRLERAVAGTPAERRVRLGKERA